MALHINITQEMNGFKLTSNGWMYCKNQLEEEKCVCKRSIRPATPLHVDLRIDDNDKIIRACPHAKNFFTDLFFDVNEDFCRQSLHSTHIVMHT